MKTTLIIMAAGLGSRFGDGIKQLARVGPSGESIMDYSIYDAKEAGFDKVVFVIRREIEKEFKEAVGNRIAMNIEVGYVYQELYDIPSIVKVPEGRLKPWGTGQAVFCCRNIVKEPFAIINADDFYGREAFVKIHDFLLRDEAADGKVEMGMVSFTLINTLSGNGTVNRGICFADKDDMLIDVCEVTGIKLDENGKILCEDEKRQRHISPYDRASMNMWAGYPKFFEFLEESFTNFLSGGDESLDKKEFYLPAAINELVKAGKVTVKVMLSDEKWFGITYKEDRNDVIMSIEKLIEEGVYPEKLWR